MNGFGFIMSFFVIWFWLSPENVGKWAAKVKRTFLEASNAE